MRTPTICDIPFAAGRCVVSFNEQQKRRFARRNRWRRAAFVLLPYAAICFGLGLLWLGIQLVRALS